MSPGAALSSLLGPLLPPLPRRLSSPPGRLLPLPRRPLQAARPPCPPILPRRWCHPGRGARPQAALLQFVNPKAWAVALIVTVSYTDPDNYLPSLVFMIVVFAIVNLPSISVWAVSGVALRRVLGDGRKALIFNIGMALLLVGSMIPVLLGSVG